ncbi:uncharacterized protein N7515_002322 [Penicillium bovifimosum]|uniref:Uncharacterized protein n=1 Tax=Penicillium bovifimosum TaxID=126998 RepID=A0A9W9L7Z4_9EURO|nr:uncharacterized protein N7515_002322 [Penicillium bovifimosum]KAJ5143535.1 hypothetical protein N7515_002322 [Penicillium bovifimosum]
MPSPLLATFVQATALNAISNVLAQLIDQRNNKTPFILNTPALLQFLIYGIIIVPPNFYWQRFLEARYPGFPTRSEVSAAFSAQNLLSFFSPRSWLAFFSKAQTESLPSHKDKEKTPLWKPRERTGLRSFLMKFFFDQTVASVVNLVLFVVIINLLKGETVGRSWELVIEDFRPIMSARLKYRPVVSVLMYTVIPVDRRVVFGSACGVIWGVYLSLYAGV